MARKQAKRRKPKAQRVKLQLPKIRLSRFLAPLAAVAVVAATYHLSSHLLDRPIESLEISGPFQRVSALRIEEAISDDLTSGFLGVDLDRVRARVEALAWIDGATVARRWPGSLKIVVSEQTPAAVWGDNGLLNVRGELFVTDLKHVPAELPRLSGPEHRAAEVAKRYLDARKRLIPLGHDLKRVDVDDRGAWQVTLDNGIEIRLGRRDVDSRTSLFLDIVANIITGHEADIQFVDMRYSNGFSIGWKDGAPGQGDDEAPAEQGMLALRGAE